MVAVLTESVNPANYWKVLKNRLKKEGNQSVTNCNQLKLRAADGKYYKTDVATAEQMFRVIQSIPSPKAELFKMWMAKVAAERIDQMQNPELSIQQALADYRLADKTLNHRAATVIFPVLPRHPFDRPVVAQYSRIPVYTQAGDEQVEICAETPKFVINAGGLLLPDGVPPICGTSFIRAVIHNQFGNPIAVNVLMHGEDFNAFRRIAPQFHA